MTNGCEQKVMFAEGSKRSAKDQLCRGQIDVGKRSCLQRAVGGLQKMASFQRAVGGPNMVKCTEGNRGWAKGQVCKGLYEVNDR